MKGSSVHTPVQEMKHLAWRIRTKLLETADRTTTPDIDASAACIESMVAAYWSVLRVDPAKPHNPDRDRFLGSNRHTAALHAVLAYRGFFPIERLEEDATEELPGIENAAGSLGHRLSLGVGIALAGRIQKRSFRVFVQMSADECRDDSVRSAAAMAAAERLENVVAIIDHPTWPAIAPGDETLGRQPMKEQWESLGWSAHDVDGHNISALVDVLANVPDGSGKPVAVVAHTVARQSPPLIDGGGTTRFPVSGADELGAA